MLTNCVKRDTIVTLEGRQIVNVSYIALVLDSSKFTDRYWYENRPNKGDKVVRNTLLLLLACLINRHDEVLRGFGQRCP